MHTATKTTYSPSEIEENLLHTNYNGAVKYLKGVLKEARDKGYSVDNLLALQKIVGKELKDKNMRDAILPDMTKDQMERVYNRRTEQQQALVKGVAALLGRAYTEQGEKNQNSGKYKEAKLAFTNAATQFGKIEDDRGIKKVNEKLAENFVDTDKAAKQDLALASKLAAEGNYGAAGNILARLHQKYTHEGNLPAAEVVWRRIREYNALTKGEKEKIKNIAEFVDNDKMAAPYLARSGNWGRAGDYPEAAIELRKLQLVYTKARNEQAAQEMRRRIEKIVKHIKPNVKAEALKRNRETIELGKKDLARVRREKGLVRRALEYVDLKK